MFLPENFQESWLKGSLDKLWSSPGIWLGICLSSFFELHFSQDEFWTSSIFKFNKRWELFRDCALNCLNWKNGDLNQYLAQLSYNPLSFGFTFSIERELLFELSLSSNVDVGKSFFL